MINNSLSSSSRMFKVSWTIFRNLFIPLLVAIWIFVMIYSNATTDSYNHPPGLLRGTNSLSVTAKLPLPFDKAKMNHLILVPGHAVLKINQLDKAHISDNSWYLLPYQRGVGYPEIIMSHIKNGILKTTMDPYSILVFSGGETRKDVGPISEGLSYYYVAKNQHWFPKEMIDNRVVTEEYARDSFENLLFSICRFKEVTGNYPSRITVIGFDFKADRFTNLHRKAIGFPIVNFNYVGLKPTSYRFNYKNAIVGEEVAVNEFQHDMYGCKDKDLVVKRRKRNPFSRTVPYVISCPEIRNLLEWCGPSMYNADSSSSPLPWSADPVMN